MATTIGGVIGAATYLLNHVKLFTTTQLERIQKFVNDAARPGPEAFA